MPVRAPDRALTKGRGGGDEEAIRRQPPCCRLRRARPRAAGRAHQWDLRVFRRRARHLAPLRRRILAVELFPRQYRGRLPREASPLAASLRGRLAAVARDDTARYCILIVTGATLPSMRIG